MTMTMSADHIIVSVTDREGVAILELGLWLKTRMSGRGKEKREERAKKMEKANLERDEKDRAVVSTREVVTIKARKTTTGLERHRVSSVLETWRWDSPA